MIEKVVSIYIKDSFHKDWRNNNVYYEDYILIPFEDLTWFYHCKWKWKNSHMADPDVKAWWHLVCVDGQSKTLHRLLAVRHKLIINYKDPREVFFIDNDPTNASIENLGVTEWSR